MRNQSYPRIILGIFVFVVFTFVYGNVSAENCLETWIEDNARNLINNPGFEEQPDFNGWTRFIPDEANESIDINHYGHNRSAKVEFNSADGIDFSFGQGYLAVNSDTTYFIQGYIDKIKGSGSSWLGSQILVKDENNKTWTTYNLEETNGWTLLRKEFTTMTDTNNVVVYLMTKGYGIVSGTVWWDDIQLLPVPEINSLNEVGGTIEISGVSFGTDPRNDPYYGNIYGDGNGNCVFYDTGCLPADYIDSWSNELIVINKTGDGSVQIGNRVLRVKSGGIVSGAKSLEPGFILSNSKISLEFPNISGGEGIGQTTDVSTGRQFLDESVHVSLYELTVKDSPFNNSKTVISSKDASSISYDSVNENGTETLTITANHCNEFIVTATILLPSSGAAQFSIDVQNSGSRVIQSVRYPLIAAKPMLGSSGTDDMIVIPEATGYLLRDPASITETYYTEIEYPGNMSMQMAAYYDSDPPDAGLYLSMDDSEGYKKRFSFDRIVDETENYINFSFNHITSEAQGNQLAVPYHINIDTFSGDWYDAADRYKQWALSQPWTSTELKDRDDVPAWLYDMQAIFIVQKASPEVFTSIVDYYKGILGVSRVLLNPGGFWGVNNGFYDGHYYTDYWGTQQTAFFNWSGIDLFADDPVYNISEENDPPYALLKTNINALQNQGSDAYFFISSLIWDNYFFELSSSYPGFESCSLLDPLTGIPDDIKLYDDRDHYYSYGDSYAVTRENTLTDLKAYMQLNDQYCRATASMCVGTDSDNIMDLAVYNNIKRGIDHDARLMSLDGIIGGKIEGCWNPGHGHPAGEGKWTHDRYVKVLNDIKGIISAKGMHGQFALSMENVNELYLQHLSFQYMRHGHLYPIYEKGNSRIPLFNYVYKEYYMGADWGSSLIFYDDNDHLINRWVLGMGFIQGNIQGTQLGSDPANDPLSPELVEFYNRLISMKRTDFYKGGMLNPPVFNGIPEATPLGSSNLNYIDTVLTNVLKTDDHTISYLLVNTELDGTYSIQFDAEQYDLPTNKVNIKIIKNSVEIDNQQDMFLPLPVSIDLDGGDVMEVRVEYWDFDGDGLNNNYELHIGTDPKNPDTDGDELNDGAEIQLTTNPLHPDTDKDRIQDGPEVNQGSDPLVIFSPHAEGWNLSRNSDFSTSDTSFSINDTFHIIVWSNIANAQPMKKAEYKIKNTSGFVHKEDLVNTDPSVYTENVALSGFSTGAYTVEIWLRDNNNDEYEKQDIGISVQ